MGSLYGKDVVDMALSQVGYQATGKWNKYAAELDEVDFFTGCGKKQGLDWCSVFTSWCAYKTTRNSSGEFEPDKYDAHYFLYQPDNNDCAAVIKYVVQYYKQNDAYYTDPQELERGDQIIFQNSDGYSHTGWCVDWDDEGFYTVEGNVSGGQVLKKFYPYNSFGGYVAGFGKPRYDGWEYPVTSDTTEPVPDPTPDPEPEPTPEPVGSYEKKKISVTSYLNVRTSPEMGNNKIGELYNGAEVYVFETVDGWARIGDNLWISADYLV